MQLCNAEAAAIWRPDGDVFTMAAYSGFSRKWAEFVKQNPLTPGRGTVTGRVFLEGRTIHIPDVLADPEFTAFEHLSRGNWRSNLGVPLLREGKTIGAFFLTRSDVKPFTSNEIELVTTFADQAVIAIENARLFDQVQVRTKELQESLEYQTAIGDVLEVISRSPSNIQPVLETIAETAQQLCQSEHAYIMLLDNGRYHLAAAKDARAARVKYLRDNPITPNRGSVVGRVALEQSTIQITDALADPEYTLSMSGDRGYRTILGVPLLRDGVVIGVVVLTRGIVQSFAKSKSSLSRPSRIRRSSRSGTLACSMRCSRAQRNWPNRWSSRRRLPRCCRSSSSSPGELEPVFEPCLRTRCGSAALSSAP